LLLGVECAMPLHLKERRDGVDDPFSQKPPFESQRELFARRSRPAGI
jgi:hypothetical protein